MGRGAGNGMVGLNMKAVYKRLPLLNAAGRRAVSAASSLVVTAAIHFALCITPAVAQQSVSLRPSIVDGDGLPYPGHPIKLTVTVIGTKNSQLTMRALLVRDGRLIEQPIDDGILDEEDRLVYTLDTFAPLAELSYQFVFGGPQGTVGISPRVVARRACIPDIRTIDTEIDPNIDLTSKLKELLRQSQGLETEVKNYETTVKLIEELQKLTEN